jgi:hypothetical protein
VDVYLNSVLWEETATLNESMTTPPLTQATTVTLQCKLTGGTILSSAVPVTIGVTCTPTYSCSGQTIQYTNSSCQVSNVTTCVAPDFCSPNSSSCLVPSITLVPTGNYTGALQISPNIVHPGNSVQVHWNVTDAQSCTVTGSNGDSWSGLSSPNNGETSAPIVSQITYTLSCQGYSGAAPPSIVDQEDVTITPTFKEL